MISWYRRRQWTREQLESFLALDTEPQKSSVNALYRPVADARWVASAWAVRKRHPVYRAFSATGTGFANVWEGFERAARKQGLLTDSTAPFRFLRVFARYASLALAIGEARVEGNGHKRKRERPDRERNSAIKQAEKLMRKLRFGSLTIGDFDVQIRAELALDSLVRDLKKKHRSYRGERALERMTLKGFASGVVSECTLSSPALVTRFADMFGFDCSESAAKQYCAAAQRKHRERVAKAKREHAAVASNAKRLFPLPITVLSAFSSVKE